MFDNIKSMPAKVCLLVSALIGTLYAINFILFSSCAVVNGDECFALIPNDADPDHESYGRGAGTLYVAGSLVLGTVMGTMLILNEGARGKWTIMIPTIAGFTCLTIVLAPPFQGGYESASNKPLLASLIALVCYVAAYFFLKEEGVDEGIGFNMGIKINNEAKYAIIISSLIGTIYTINHMFFADGYAGAAEGFSLITGYDYGTYCAENVEVVSGVLCDPIAATPLTYRVLAAFFVTYVSMGLILLTHGAKGNWPVAHILLFGITFFTLAVIMGNLVLNDQVIPAGPNEGTHPIDNSTATANIIVCVIVLSLNLFAYYKMREEGVEDGMTMMGEDFEPKDSFFFKMYPTITAVYVVLILIANFVTQVQS